METTDNPSPESYDQNLAEHICDLVASGLSLDKIEQLPNMPARRTIREWQKKFPSFTAAYALAREERAEFRFDRLDKYKEMLMNGQLMPDVANVLINTERWQAAKENFKRYGDKQAIEQTNTHTHNVVVSDMSTASLLAELQRTAQVLPGGVKLQDDKLIIDATYTSDDTSKG